MVPSRMAEVTFRDFAAAIMKGDAEGAGRVLQPLLGLEAGPAAEAAGHFAARSAAEGPAFLGKAMGLRTALASGSSAEISGLLGDCFGLTGEPLATALATLARSQPR